MVISSYLVVKLLYLANAILQLVLMTKFLEFDRRCSFSSTKAAEKNQLDKTPSPSTTCGNSYGLFGFQMLKDLMAGKDWNDTLVFPRVTFCYIRNMHGVKQVHFLFLIC